MTITTGKPLAHWPKDTVAEEGTWRDFYTREKLENYSKPWYKKHDER